MRLIGNFKLNHWIVNSQSCHLSVLGAQAMDVVALEKVEMAILLTLSQQPHICLSAESLINELKNEYDLNLDLEKLNQAVLNLQRALGDRPKAPQIIDTCNEGFQLLVSPKPLTPLPDISNNNPNDIKQDALGFTLRPSTTATAHPHAYKGILIIFLLFLTLIIAMAIIGLSSREAPIARSSTTISYSSSSINGKIRLAVLPFVIDSATQGYDYLSEGIAEELIDDLSQNATLQVIARDSAFNFRSDPAEIFKIGAKLNTHYVITGKVSREKNNLHVFVQLQSMDHLLDAWSKSYDMDYAKVFMLQNELINDVAEQLNLQLSSKRSAHSPALSEPQLRAYDQYLKGRYYATQQGGSNLTKARLLFEQAINDNPHLTDAYISLADTMLQQSQWPLAQDNEFALQCQKLLEQTLIESPNSAQAHGTQGRLLARIGQDDKAQQAYETAITLQPNYAKAHLWLGELYQNQLNLFKAKTSLANAFKLDPYYSEVNLYLGRNYLLMGELEEGIKYLTRAINSSKSVANVEYEMARWFNDYGYQEKTEQWAKVAYAKAPKQYNSYLAMAFGQTSNAPMHQWLDKAHQIETNDSENFLDTVNLYFYRGDMIALSHYVRQQLYTSSGELDINKPLDWQLWAGIVKINTGQYDQAATLFTRILASYPQPTFSPIAQLRLLNLLAYTYKKMDNSEQLNGLLPRLKTVQNHLLDKGLKTPFFVVQLIAYYAITNEQDKAEQLLRNALLKGWKLDNYIANDPIFELLDHRATTR